MMILRPGYDPSGCLMSGFQNGDRLPECALELSARTDELMVKENSLPKACERGSHNVDLRG